jgi:hypothetical protein
MGTKELAVERFNGQTGIQLICISEHTNNADVRTCSTHDIGRSNDVSRAAERYKGALLSGLVDGSGDDRDSGIIRQALGTFGIW